MNEYLLCRRVYSLALGCERKLPWEEWLAGTIAADEPIIEVVLGLEYCVFKIYELNCPFQFIKIHSYLTRSHYALPIRIGSNGWAQCGAGLFVKNKNAAHKSCAQCPAGTLSSD